MDFFGPPTVLTTNQVTLKASPWRILSAISQGRRACVLVNRGPGAIYLGSDNVDTITGFLLQPGESLSLATAAAVWATPVGGIVHILTLSR